MCIHQIPQTWYKGDMECTVCYTTSRCITTAHHLPKRGPKRGPKGVEVRGYPYPYTLNGTLNGTLKTTRRRPVIRTKGRHPGFRVRDWKQVFPCGPETRGTPGIRPLPSPDGSGPTSDPRTSGPPTHLDLTHLLGISPHLDVLISIVLKEDNTP